MASCITSQWSNSTSPQARLTVDAVNVNSSITNLNWKLEYVGHGYPPHSYGGRAYTVTVAGETVASGNYDINGLTGTYTIASGTKQVTRGTSNQTVSFSLSFAFNLTWTGVYSGTRSASGSITVPARPSNIYSFDANGGSGAPSAVTKWGGIDFTFPTGRPSRAGHTFNGWFNSGINNGTLYQPGQTVGSLPDQPITWYAWWTAYTYTVKYNANGGSGAPGQQTKTYGVTLTLSSTKPTRTNYTFKGWGTSSGSTTVAYAAGGSYTANASITLYAIWELNYTKPKITSITVDRCNSAGTLNDEGTYAKVSFKWSIDSTATLKDITVGYKPYKPPGTPGSSGTFEETPITASGTSGTASKVFGGFFDTETSYDIQIAVYDSKGSTIILSQLPPTHFIMDVSPQGGVGFGGPAPNSKNAQFYENLIMDGKAVYMNDGAPIYFKDINDENAIKINRAAGTGQLAIHAKQVVFFDGYDGDSTGSGYTDASTGGGNLLGVSHVCMRQNAGIYWRLTSGSDFNVLRMNTSNQVEFNWTSGGLKGRVRKQLWAGTWTSGYLTISDLPYYNVFLIGFSATENDDYENGYLVACRNAAGNVIAGCGAVFNPNENYPVIATADFAVDGTRIAYTGMAIQCINEAIQLYRSGRKILRITGLL